MRLNDDTVKPPAKLASGYARVLVHSWTVPYKSRRN